MERGGGDTWEACQAKRVLESPPIEVISRVVWGNIPNRSGLASKFQCA